MQIKDRAIIKIESVAFGGEGVGRIDNFVVFVPFSAPGDSHGDLYICFPVPGWRDYGVLYGTQPAQGR